ncbi:MAG: sarcosine oxidase subunit alpha family protein [Pseudomonadota bacterium]
MSDTTQPFRLAEGGLIDRSRPLRFQFDGQPYTGFAGDTLASALIANGVHFVGRSFKYHRPRGFVSAGVEEPNALFQVGYDPRTEPNVKGTIAELVDGMVLQSQNAFPTLGTDIGAINARLSKFIPAGFYYKTFMGPGGGTRSWMFYERFIRKAAGLGHAPTQPDPDHYDKTYAHTDVLVVGSGPAGLAAALAAGRAGARVLLVEMDSRLGGHLLSTPDEEIEGLPALAWVEKAGAELESLANVTVKLRTMCFAAYDHNFFALWENVSDHLTLEERPEKQPRHRLIKLRTAQAIFAAGAIERPLIFRDNDRPGSMLAASAATFLQRFAVKPGTSAVLTTNNDSAYRAALALAAGGVEIAAVADLREAPSGPWTEKAQQQGMKILAGQAVYATAGKTRIKGVSLGKLDASGKTLTERTERIACDLVLNSGGWTPSVHLHSQAKGKLIWEPETQVFRPGVTGQAGQHSVGACNGTFGLGAILDEGHQAGVAASEALGHAQPAGAAPQAESEGFLPLRPLWLIPADKPVGHKGKHFVDQQNDVTAADLKLAMREGFRSIEHLKRYTTTGMATDQGKTSNLNALTLVAETLAKPVPEVGTTTFRPPFAPVSFGAWMGRDVGDLLDPLRKTAMDSWHEAAGAVFEPVGQWRRPWYYPQEGETMLQTVNRECLAVREGVGLLDASTLGKIDIKGPDAAAFLNAVYTNAWSKLGVGRCRYGLMLGEDGMVMDDGVTARLGEQHYLMHTTSGNAASVMAHLEEYLQTEWPEMKVFLTSVTEQWATAQIAGPYARDLLAEIAPDLDLSAEALPHMSMTEGIVAGREARVFRVSFTGEASFEVIVPSSYGLGLWEALMRAGAKYGATPFGTEAMHVLRAEKGFIIVGQETDGSVNPHDLGMDWIVSKTKDFVGKRSLTRADMSKPDRKQLVGLLTETPEDVLPEGAQLVETVSDERPLPMLGHVTSSYWSPSLQRSIAMALVKGGRARKGQTIHAPLEDGRVLSAEVVDPLFYDKDGSRLHV